MPVETRRARARTYARALMCDVPEELAVLVAQALDDPRDLAALCLATPRLGAVVRRALPKCRTLLFDVAMRVARGESITEAMMRWYVGIWEATADGCAWLNRWAEAAGAEPRLVVVPHPLGPMWFVQPTADVWSMVKVRDESRCGSVCFYVGRKWHERKVRREKRYVADASPVADGPPRRCERRDVYFYEGQQRNERCTLFSFTDTFDDGVVLQRGVFTCADAPGWRWTARRAPASWGVASRSVETFGARGTKRVAHSNGTVVEYDRDGARVSRTKQPHDAFRHEYAARRDEWERRFAAFSRKLREWAAA